MELQQETNNGATILRPIERLSNDGAPILEAAVEHYLKNDGKFLILDFSKLSYISSVGLRVVLKAGKEMRKSQGKFAISGLNQNVRSVFEMSGFISLFNVYENISEALINK